MTIENMKNTIFDKADFEQWKSLAVESLKGKPFDKLSTKTLEGIELQPLYYEASDPGNTAIIQEMKQQRGWIIAQQTIADDAASFLEQLRISIDRGNESIVYDGTNQIIWEEEELLQLAELFTEYPLYMFNIDSEDPILRAFDFVNHEVRPRVHGIVASIDWTAPVGYPNLRTQGADLWDIHHSGSDAVTELAVALATASKLASASDSFADFSADFFVRFAVDTHFFMEIAKLRAFRVLWKAFSKAYDVDVAPIIPVAAITSIRSYSKLDPYVNLLRAGNETFAAVLGGADIITNHPHDILTGPSASSIRYSRNIQLVLREESHIGKVLDPAGGSYFIEKLTDELVRNSWALFLEIEKAGGIDSFLLDDHLHRLADERKRELASGKKSLIGTNTYAELAQMDLKDWNGIKKVDRPASMFEAFREKFAQSQPDTVILTFGQLKDFKPRADFVTGFLATGGIHSKWSPAFDSAEEAVVWLGTEKPEYAIVCANDETVRAVMETLLHKLPTGIVLDVAGKFDDLSETAWKEKGLSGTIYNGQDKIAKLESIHELHKGGHRT